MSRLKNRYDISLCVIFTVLSLFSISLIFNNNVWFDEAYTLSLIRHDFAEIIEILKTDMHPPLYFISLKCFCKIFGYSTQITKVFSIIGYVATLSLGLSVIKKHFGCKVSAVYMLCVGAVPMSLYFSVQQRSYQWCVFFVALCFIEALLFLEKRKLKHCIIFTAAALFAAYNHIYALLAVGIIFAFVNIYAIVKNRRLLKAVIISDAAVIAGYSPWIIPLLTQTESAAGSFWLTGVEVLSVIVFACGIVICALILIKKGTRKLPVVFAAVCVLSIQAVGLLVTIFIRPFYIARYCVVILGIFAMLVAFGIENIKETLRNFICVLLCIMNIACATLTGIFKYNSSMSDFFEGFEKISSSGDAFLYCDSSFGILSYYYPENTHICTYYESWFAAFDNVQYTDKSELSAKLSSCGTVWFVKNELTKTPEYIENNFKMESVGSFKCDFNTFEVYLIQS